MILLGVKIGDHSSNVSVVVDGKVRYHKSERKYKLKHLGLTDYNFWVNVIKDWGIAPEQITAAAIVIDPELTSFPFSKTDSYEKIPHEYLPGICLTCPVFRIDHHFAHSLSCWTDPEYYPGMPALVFDGDGDFNRSYSVFKNNTLVETATTDKVESFGAVLEDAAILAAIKGHKLDLAGKAMGLKSYGSVSYDYLELFSDHSLFDISQLTNINLWNAITNNRLPIDYLATLHAFAEQTFPRAFSNFVSKTLRFSYSGGVAQSSVLNGILQEQFPNMIIPPHCTDDGLSLGCVEWLRQHYYLPKLQIESFPFAQDDAAPTELPSHTTIEQTAELLASGKIVGWYQGHGEVGPRALGNRSILMRPDLVGGKQVINSKVKHREWYRPFGCSIIESRQQEIVNASYSSPYMLHVAELHDPKTFASIAHVDGTTRFQTVSQDLNLPFFSLLESFDTLTGLPVLLNTSLNVNGKPIASTPDDALTIFDTTDIDAIVVGNEIRVK